MGVTFGILPGKSQAEPEFGLAYDAPLSDLVAWTERVLVRRGGAWWSGRSPVIGGRPVATLRLPYLPPTALVAERDQGRKCRSLSRRAMPRTMSSWLTWMRTAGSPPSGSSAIQISSAAWQDVIKQCQDCVSRVKYTCVTPLGAVTDSTE